MKVSRPEAVPSPKQDMVREKQSPIPGQDMTRGELPKSKFNITDDWYKAIIQSATEGFFLTNRRCEILDVNDALCNMLGYSREELLSMKIYDFDTCFRYNPEELLHAFQNTKDMGSVIHDVRHRRKDGQVIDLDVSIKYLDIEPGLFFCFHRDITEKKRMVEQLKESEERYRTLIELGGQIGEAVIMIQDSGKGKGIQTFVSDEWSRITGYSREELLGMSFFDILHPKYRAASMERHQKKINGDSIPQHFEMSIIRKDGIKVPIEVTSAYTTYKGKKANVAYIRDITDRKKLEREIKKYHRHLIDMVEDRTAELKSEIEQRNKAELELQELYLREQELRKQLQQQTEERIWFTRALVHEIKTPLTSLLGSSDLLASNIKEEPWVKLANNVNQSAEFLRKRIDELFTYARSEIGVLSIKLEEIDPKELLKSVYDIEFDGAYSRGQKLVLEVPESLPVIKADADRLQEVILNLLDNAFKSCSAGDVITLSCRSEDNNLEFSVQDTGCGIPRDEQDLLFNPYYRMERQNISDSAKLGIGIGLSICKSIVELHKGRIWVESENGKGSTFSFLIPIDPNCNETIKEV